MPDAAWMVRMPPVGGEAIRRRSLFTPVVSNLRERLTPIDRPPTEHALRQCRGGDRRRPALLESKRHAGRARCLPRATGPLSRGILSARQLEAVFHRLRARENRDLSPDLVDALARAEIESEPVLCKTWWSCGREAGACAPTEPGRIAVPPASAIPSSPAPGRTRESRSAHPTPQALGPKAHFGAASRLTWLIPPSQALSQLSIFPA